MFGEYCMLKYAMLVICVLGIGASLCGCGIKRPPQNAFPGSEEYEARVATFKVSPREAYEIAREEAEYDNKLQFLSKRPTVLNKRWYVFSMPQGSGASLQGYHVHGDTGQVKFFSQKRTVTNTR